MANLDDEKIFNDEVLLCKTLSKENNGKCAWGKCEDCGVIPLLFKIYIGQLLEEPEEIKKIKDSIFKT